MLSTKIEWVVTFVPLRICPLFLMTRKNIWNHVRTRVSEHNDCSCRVILNIALVKHDGPAALKQKMLPKEHDLPEHKARMHRVLEMIDKLQPSSELKLKWTCQPLPRQVTKYFSRERTDYQEDDAKRAIQRMLDYEVQLQNMPESRKSIAARNDCRRLFINTEISKQTGWDTIWESAHIQILVQVESVAVKNLYGAPQSLRFLFRDALLMAFWLLLKYRNVQTVKIQWIGTWSK